MELYLNSYEQLKKVENFLFRYIYPEDFSLCIYVNNERFNYRTVYNNLAHGLVLETF